MSLGFKRLILLTKIKECVAHRNETNIALNTLLYSLLGRQISWI